MNRKGCLIFMLLQFQFGPARYFQMFSDLKGRAFVERILMDCFYSVFLFFLSYLGFLPHVPHLQVWKLSPQFLHWSWIYFPCYTSEILGPYWTLNKKWPFCFLDATITRDDTDVQVSGSLSISYPRSETEILSVPSESAHLFLNKGGEPTRTNIRWFVFQLRLGQKGSYQHHSLRSVPQKRWSLQCGWTRPSPRIILQSRCRFLMGSDFLTAFRRSVTFSELLALGCLPQVKSCLKYGFSRAIITLLSDPSIS